MLPKTVVTPTAYQNPILFAWCHPNRWKSRLLHVDYQLSYALNENALVSPSPVTQLPDRACSSIFASIEYRCNLRLCFQLLWSVILISPISVPGALRGACLFSEHCVRCSRLHPKCIPLRLCYLASSLALESLTSAMELWM